MAADDPYLAAGASLSSTPAPQVATDPYAAAGATEANSDPYAVAGAVQKPALTDQEFNQKMPRWGPILSGQSFGSPADFAEMEASGRFTPDQLQRAQTETSLRQAYTDEQAQTTGQKAKAVGSAALSGVGNMLQDITVVPRIIQAHNEMAANPSVWDAVTPPGGVSPRVVASALEGGYQAGAGLANLAKGLVTGPAKWIKDAYQGITGAPASTEQDYQDWKMNYLKTHAVPGYAAPNTNGAVNTAISAATGVPAEALPQPVAPLTSLASTAATLPLWGGAAKLTEGVIPKALEATGLNEAAPTLSKLITPTTDAAKLQSKMKDALTGTATEATPTATSAAVDATGKAISATSKAASAVGSAPTKLAQWLTAKATGSPELADQLGKYVDTSEWLAAPLATAFGAPHIGAAIGAVKLLEKAGAIGEGLGDFMSRVATANPTDPFGQFMALAADKEAPTWMRQIAQSPAVQFALKSGTLAGKTAAGFAKGAATGGAISLVSHDNPEEAGANIGGMGLFGALHGAMPARESSIFNANLGAVGKYVSDSIDSGVSPETLRLVPADQILQASLWSNINPDWKVRFGTANDPSSPFVKGGTGEGQAGVYDTPSKTLWVDPTKRAPDATLTHESFHPIFDNLVSQQPDVKETLDQALAADGRSIDQFKQQYADRVFPNNPTAAADYVKNQDSANPNWAYAELLADSAAHELSGKDLLQAAQGKNVQQSATQAALGGMDGWLSAQGVQLREKENGTVFPDFENVFTSPEVRKMTYKMVKSQRETVLGKTGPEGKGTPLTKMHMGTKVAPFYTTPQGQKINPYGQMVPNGKGGEVFRAWPSSELKKRGALEAKARAQYFPSGKTITSMPAGLEADPNIAPWTKAALKNVFDSMQSGEKVSMWYHRLNNENSATSDLGRAADLARHQGNVRVSWQSGKPLGVELTKKGNLITRWESEEAENQKLADWANRHGELSLDLWGGDQAKAKADIKTYLNNHATGQPGDANGIGTQKRDVINALLAGSNKEFEAKNPLRALLKGKDRAGTMRSLRVDRMESAQPDVSDRPPAQWENLKRNLSPAPPGFEPRKQRDIELTGPDGTKYPAKYGGIQETGDPKNPWLTITPMEDLPGATVAKSTTFAHSLEKKGFKVPQELWDERQKFIDSNQGMQFSPSAKPKAISAAAVRDKKTGRIFAGSSHRDAAAKSPKAPQDLEDGFVTNDGTFVTREKAMEHAIAMKQYKASEADYNKDKERYGLTSERFNKQNPSSTTAVAEEALSNKQPQTLRPGVSPAVKWKGKIYTEAQLEKMKGSTVIDKLHNAGALKDSDWTDVDYDNPDKPSGYLVEHGFADKSGKWVSEKKAYAPLARQSYSPAVEAKNIRNPDQNIRDQASEYAKERGLSEESFSGYAPLNEDLGKRTADAYEAAPHIPDDPKVQASYKALADETRAQWDFLTKKGVTFEPWTAKGQPYESSKDMRNDVNKNKHLWFFPTQQGFGEGEAASNNPMLTPTGITVDNIPLVTNDLFRAVHDYFGHAKEGYEFGPRGEYNAYLAHSRMFSDAARPALTAETMGQNSWVNFGKHLRDEVGNIPKKGEEGYVAPQERPFAEQKATVLPDDLTAEALKPTRPLPKEIEDAKEPGTVIGTGTFSPPAMSDKAWQDLAGKRMMFVVGDQQDAGRDYITKDGNPVVPLMGGPGYPHLEGNEGKAGWAATYGQRTRMTNALKDVDYLAVVAGGPDMVSGSISFAKAYIGELRAAVKAGEVKPSVLDRLAREAGRRVKAGVGGKSKARPIPTIHNFKEMEDLVNTIRKGRPGDPGSEGLPFAARSAFWKFIGSATNQKKFGTPDYAQVRDRFNDTGAFQPGEIAQVIKINKDKAPGSAEEHGVIEHPSYEVVIPGKGLGKPPQPLMMQDALKDWLESPEISAKGGDARYKVQQMMPKSKINDEHFSPAAPETVKSAAVRIDRDNVVTADTHSAAFAKARKEGLVTEDDLYGPRHEDGFVTSAGRFVMRQEGYNLAKNAQQLKTEQPEFTGNGTWLDASNLKPVPASVPAEDMPKSNIKPGTEEKSSKPVKSKAASVPNVSKTVK